MHACCKPPGSNRLLQLVEDSILHLSLNEPYKGVCKGVCKGVVLMNDV